MDIFDGRNKDWTLDSGCKNKDRICIFSKYAEYADNNSIKSCNVDISKRIGMESTMAEVYKVNIKENFPVAVKILPIINIDSYSNNEKEFRFAIRASELVLAGQSKYFPIVYNLRVNKLEAIYLLSCKETYFYGSNKPNLKFYEKSLRYQQFQALLDSQIEQKVIDKILSYKKKFLDAEQVINILHKNKDFVNIDLSTKVASHLLVSEIACFDLDYYLDNNILTDKQFYYLLKDIFLAITDMYVKLNILHNDLHLGNILMIKENSRYIPLIHDFGKSKEITINKNMKDIMNNDLFYFISKFEEKIKNNENISKILISLDEVVNVALESENNFPIIDIVKYWNNVEDLF